MIIRYFDRLLYKTITNEKFEDLDLYNQDLRIFHRTHSKVKAGLSPSDPI